MTTMILHFGYTVLRDMSDLLLDLYLTNESVNAV
jgi:hypothetical protein